nr:hypothetical protein Iba_chr14cCG1030 [Ipomoea batatas]
MFQSNFQITGTSETETQVFDEQSPSGKDYLAEMDGVTESEFNRALNIEFKQIIEITLVNRCNKVGYDVTFTVFMAKINVTLTLTKPQFLPAAESMVADHRRSDRIYCRPRPRFYSFPMHFVCVLMGGAAQIIGVWWGQRYWGEKKSRTTRKEAFHVGKNKHP